MVKPWYKQFWPWVLIALPASAVIGSLFTFYIFSQNSVEMVTDNYYKKGKAINKEIGQLKEADKLHIKANVKVDEHQIILHLDKGQLVSLPTLNIKFSHRTLSKYDFHQLVNPDANGNYRIHLDEPLIGPWFVQISPHDNQWVMQNRISFPSVDTLPLYGQDKG
ncbi:FixH family protein [Vibrio sp. SS-MA-C1-2]|uniref:FixH family protein n=1 Tax=Vibrio sp. SS-MA-C1-2 TaxID=2908646 RepID=UPI001F46EC21|nr:FixH family protein [Vibrio sp. SS-MA-C1-2]UJF18109.1 FixH family protein [Vibrio sp. SS-MA-C1-2]